MSHPQATGTRRPELGRLQVGEWSIRQAEGTLSSNGRSVRLEPRVMDVLVYLTAHSERVVPKEELIEAVWGGAFVEEGALSQAIHSLRKVLGDDARQPRYIQTIPKRGYRLVAPVAPEATVVEVAEVPPHGQEPKRAPWARSGWRLLLLGAIGIALMVALGRAWEIRDTVRLKPEQAASVASKGVRIVVLPFENKGNPEDTFFADGLTEEITKDLASFPSLQVISRTSAVLYARSGKTPPEIGRELGVTHVLEGTVRWAKGSDGRTRVRITPQLIRTADDTHVWASTFDREVEDIFEVQAEISRRVIGQLGIALTSKEILPLRPPPTENLEAYQAYLRGLEFKNQPFYSEKHVQMAVPMFERAVELDPNFATAWAELSQTHSYIAFNSDQSPGRIEKARQALGRSISLSPDLPVVRLAQAHFTYRCLKDFDSAHKQLVTALQLFPNDAEVLQTLGFVLRRRGQLAQAVELLQRAFSLDPKTVKLVWAIAETYRALRNFEEADRYYSQAIALAPDQPVYWEEKALNRLLWTGDLEEAHKILNEAPIPEHPGLVPVAFQLDFYGRDYKRALARLSPERMRDLTLIEQSRLATLAAIARERLGDHHGALAAAEANRATLEARVARFPEGSFYRAYLAVALAQLGRKSEAITQAEQAVRQKHKDAFSGPRMVQIQAMVDVISGRNREAIERLAWLLSTPYKSSICQADLRLDPVWDPLRRDPRFEELVQRFDD